MDDERLAALESRLEKVELASAPSVVYIVLSNIRNVEAFRDRAMAEARRHALDPDDMNCPATACLFRVPLG